MKKPIRTTGLICSVLLLLPLLITGCAKLDEEPAAEAYSALEDSFRDALSEVTSGEDWGMDEYKAVFVSFESQFEELADTYWGTGAALDAKLWMLGSLNYQEDEDVKGAAQEEILGTIFSQYSRSPKMERVAGYYRSATEDQREKYFARLQKRSPHAEVRAAVIYSVVNTADMDINYGDEDVDREAAIELRRTNLQLLADEYPDIPHRDSTYGQTAERMLSAHDPSDLEIGKKAPEIIGTDVDGNEMKLSDYLGKVVVIDFWGDW